VCAIITDVPRPTPLAATLPPLARLLQAQLELPATDACENAGRTPEWLQAPGWRVYATAKRQRRQDHAAELLESFTLPSGDRLDALRLGDGSVIVPFDFDEAYQNFLSERWRVTDLRMLGELQLMLYYRVKRLLPRELQIALRRLFIRLRATPSFPSWPLELSVDRLARFYGRCLLAYAEVEQAPFTWFWPEAYHAAVVLTHDVETGDGLRRALELADLEQERGFRSSFNVVAGGYPIDDGILRELVDRGFEIGLHGLHHDRSLFSSRAEFERQLPALVAAAERFGSDGFRSPATHRVLEWLPDLPALYDCTVPHADRYEPQPGGCCSLWPYSIGRIIELPWTVPQDHILFTLLRQRSAAVWLQQVQEIERRFGLIQCLSHPDRGYLGDADKRAHYVELLDALAERPALWRALPREVAAWWHGRDVGVVPIREGTMRVGTAPDYVSFEPPL
jgi:peptidoglycan/xylan/chitin deacetylase (PgdA/CDA1 family)